VSLLLINILHTVTWSDQHPQLNIATVTVKKHNISFPAFVCMDVKHNNPCWYQRVLSIIPGNISLTICSV